MKRQKLEIKNMPTEIQYKIIRYLDIDTRRILGLYTKLKIPESIVNTINAIPKINVMPMRSAVFLGNEKSINLSPLDDLQITLPLYQLNFIEFSEQNYIIHRNDELERIDFYNYNTIQYPSFSLLYNFDLFI